MRQISFDNDLFPNWHDIVLLSVFWFLVGCFSSKLIGFFGVIFLINVPRFGRFCYVQCSVFVTVGRESRRLTYSGLPWAACLRVNVLLWFGC